MHAKPVEILLAEDNQDDVILIKEAFADGKLLNVVNVVSDGQAALDYLRKEGPYKDAIMPGIVVLDVNMPKKDGLETLHEIKGDPQLKHLPVIMLTTSKREEDIVTAYSDGACSYISKPVGLEEFDDVAKQLGLYWALIAKIPGNQ